METLAIDAVFRSGADEAGAGSGRVFGSGLLLPLTGLTRGRGILFVKAGSADARLDPLRPILGAVGLRPTLRAGPMRTQGIDVPLTAE